MDNLHLHFGQNVQYFHLRSIFIAFTFAAFVHLLNRSFMKIYQNSFPGKDVTKAFVCFCLSLAFFPIFSFGQTNLPEGLKFKMVFDEKTLHYTALFDEADLSRLSAMDKAMFQRYSEERSVETRIDLNNDVYTNITIAHPQAPAGMTPIAKMSIDKTGVRLYDVA